MATLAEYGELLGTISSYATVSLALAVAKQTGIGDVLLTAEKPLTSHEVAQKASLKERYVREVLSSLASARIIQLVSSEASGNSDSAVYRFLVPEEYGPSFKHALLFAPIIPAIAKQYDPVKECFKLDTPSCARYDNAMFEALDELGREGSDTWLQIALNTSGLRDKLEKGIEVLELGCGSGWMTRSLSQMFPESRFTCTDALPRPVECARKLVQEAGLTNVAFQIVDACDVPVKWAGKFDWTLAQNVIHDLPYPQKALEGIYKSLKPGGTFTMIDECVSSYLPQNIGNKDAALLYSCSIFLCIPESFQKPDSQALGACWGEERATKLVETAGMRVLNVEKFKNIGTQAVWTCLKKT